MPGGIGGTSKVGEDSGHGQLEEKLDIGSVVCQPGEVFLRGGGAGGDSRAGQNVDSPRLRDSGNRHGVHSSFLYHRDGELLAGYYSKQAADRKGFESHQLVYLPDGFSAYGAVFAGGPLYSGLL